MAVVNQLGNRMFVEEKQHQQHQQHQQQQQPWIPDERDSFISWLRSEFAAANAIIDAMCQHLQGISSVPGEYDFVLNCVRQRRYNWTAVLHMQQYFSVEEVVMALQQVAVKKRQQIHGAGSGDSALWGESDLRRPLPGPAPSPSPVPAASTPPRAAPAERKTEIENGRVSSNSNTKVTEVNASSSRVEKTEEHGSSQELARSTDPDQNSHWDQSSSSLQGASGSSEKLEKAEEQENRAAAVKITKNFQSLENVDGRVVNVVEGLRICENVFTALESEQLVTVLRDLQGRKVELGATGYKIVGGKRLSKAKSSESVQQLGPDNADEPQRSSTQDETTEPLPVTLQVIIDRLLECQILPASKRPDSYIVNFLGEGGYLPPQTNSQEFDQPFCIITLQSEFTMVFGRFITMDSPRDFRSQFKLLVSVGSVLVLQGNSAKLARYAIPALPTKRCCLVLGKTVSKRFSRNMGFQRSSSSGGLINRPANNAQTLSPVIPPNQIVPNVSSPMQPGFPANAATPPQAFPPLPVMTPGGWSPVPRPGRLISGTGVFLPYNASSGPGRPSSNHRNSKHGGPVLQKMNSLPASFRSQNGITPASSSGKAIVEEQQPSSSSSSGNASASSSSAPSQNQTNSKCSSSST